MRVLVRGLETDGPSCLGGLDFLFVVCKSVFVFYLIICSFSAMTNSIKIQPKLRCVIQISGLSLLDRHLLEAIVLRQCLLGQFLSAVVEYVLDHVIFRRYEAFTQLNQMVFFLLNFFLANEANSLLVQLKVILLDKRKFVELLRFHRINEHHLLTQNTLQVRRLRLLTFR